MANPKSAALAPRKVQMPKTPVKPEDQKAAQPATQDQTPAKARAKRVVKEGSTVDKWQKSNKAGEFKTGKIFLIQPYVDESHPKRKAAGVRYSVYENGMTVEEYQKRIVERKLNTAAGVLSDVRWDVAKGLIRVES